VREIIATALAVPFIIVTTWLGITAVNSWSDDMRYEQRRDSYIEQQQERRSECYTRYGKDAVDICRSL